jgi:hypothetical protein
MMIETTLAGAGVVFSMINHHGLALACWMGAILLLFS